MVVGCGIKFTKNTHGIYFCGQVVTGQVILKIDEATTVRGIYLTIRGFAETYWSENDASITDFKKMFSKSEDYSGREDYFNTKTYLLGSETDKPHDITPGIYSYDFSYGLPSILPSSFEGEHGCIRYLIKVVIDRPSKIDLTYNVGFTVLKLVNLNYDTPLLRIRSEGEITREFCYGPCRSNPLYIYATIPQSGYVSGEVICVNATVNNRSRVDIKEISFQLEKVIIYKSQTPNNNKTEESINVISVNAGSVKRKTFQRFHEEILIPAVPASDTFPSKLIQISYYVKIEAQPDNMYNGSTVRIPITIGTIPLTGKQQQKHKRSMSVVSQMFDISPQSVRRASFGDVKNTENINLNPDVIDSNRKTKDIGLNLEKHNLSQPAFVESAYMKQVKMGDDDENALKETDFIPRYPVYNFSDCTKSETIA